MVLLSRKHRPDDAEVNGLHDIFRQVSRHRRDSAFVDGDKLLTERDALVGQEIGFKQDVR